MASCRHRRTPRYQERKLPTADPLPRRFGCFWPRAAPCYWSPQETGKGQPLQMSQCCPCFEREPWAQTTWQSEVVKKKFSTSPVPHFSPSISPIHGQVAVKRAAEISSCLLWSVTCSELLPWKFTQLRLHFTSMPWPSTAWSVAIVQFSKFLHKGPCWMYGYLVSISKL